MARNLDRVRHQHPHDGIAVKVWGGLACFTRPEMKVERVSYPVMTPSAAVGLLESIFWRPEFRWHVESIAVLNPITYTSFVRNEVDAVASFESAHQWAKGGGTGGLVASEHRQQRHTLALRDVKYVITATPEPLSGAEDARIKAIEQARRRIARGACFQRPYLGCREFVADFEPTDGTEEPIRVTRDLGRMLLRIEHGQEGARATPIFFDAWLQNGVLYSPRHEREPRDAA